jgi:hypothetical protein
MIGYKLKYVLLPKMREEKGKELRNCISFLNLCNRGSMGTFDSLPHASFVIIWVGAFIVTLNA